MSIVSWKRTREIFHEAVDLPESERAAYVAAACGDDARLRTEVERLLAAHEGAGEFMSSPTRNDAALARGDDASTSEPAEGPGSRIGRYKLLELIGEGGFGSVYMAEQEEPIRRRVALKIIKLGMDTREVIARFEAERQALAMMDHSNIARVYDAGATDSGRPYFVMELVKGVPITEYCDAKQLGTRERLELFLDVCRAVDHAHAKGIIHRDLKPSNVMVTLHDGTPVPKVIDFGIAKATSHRLTEKTLFTRYGEFVGTPAYMSPEQAEMSGLEVDRRSDIYTLGALLYELLTGTPPFEPASLRSAALVEVLRILREEDPPTPSTRVGTLGDRLEAIAKRRSAEPQRLARLLKGDLDWIVMKAMEKERTRRYDSAATLAEDVERHLRHQPVTARRPGLPYRSRKFVRRRRKPILAAAAIVGATVAAGSFAATLGPVARASSRESTGFALRRVIASGPTPLSGALSPDGRQVLFIDWPSENVATLPGHADVAIRDLENDAYRRVTRRPNADDVYPDVPIWSRDAEWIAYMDWVEGWTHQQLRLVRPDGTDDHAIVDNPQMGVAQPMAFATSGEFVIALLRGWDDAFRIGRVSLEGSLTILKTLGRERPRWVSLSPDDRYVAYDLPAADGSGGRDLFALAVDGSVELPIAPHPGEDERAFWTPEGDRIVFMSDRSGQRGLWQVAWRDEGPAGEATPVHDRLDGMTLLGLTAAGSPYFGLANTTTEVYVADVDLGGPGRLGTPSVLPETALLSNQRPAWSPDGSRVAWLSSRGPGRDSPYLVIKTMDSGEETAHPLSTIFPSGGIGRGGRPDWSLDGRYIWVEGRDPDMPGRSSFRIDVATGEIEREEYLRDYAGMNQGKISEFHFVDGRQSAGLRSVGVRLLGQTDIRQFAVGDVALRPGERLIWVREGVNEIVGDLVDGGPNQDAELQPLRPLVPSERVCCVNWSLSPEGTRLAVAAFAPGSWLPNVLYVVPLDGSEPIELARLPPAPSPASSQEAGRPHFEAVRWAPDGKRVIYAVQETGEADDFDPADIWIVDASGGEPMKLGFSLSPYTLGNLRFNPDGSRIVYTVPRNGSELWLAEGLPWQRPDGS